MRKFRLLTMLLLLVLLYAALHPWRTAQADTYEVTNTNNSGPGSLRQAISDANNNPGPDTITFHAATNGIPIVLAGAASEDANASGDLDILDGGDLTIQGNGAGNTIIDGDDIDRVFHVCPGGGCVNTVSFSGVTIQNGYVSSGGGGILNEGATLNIQNSAIGESGAGNRADWDGGGIHNSAGTLTVDDSKILANSAYYGGGISNYSTLIVQNGSIIGGASVGNGGIVGGGIYNGAGTTTVDGSTLIANGANYGGGIFNDNGTVTVSGSAVNANLALSRGGGIWNLATLVVQDGSTIGGPEEGNTANSDGGGIYNIGDGVITVDASTVSYNMAGNGGGIYNLAELYVQNGSTIGGVGAGNSAGYDGGGIYNDNGVVTVDSSVVSANSADNGGGIYNDLNGIVTVDDSTISANTVADDGGGIYNHGDTMTVNASMITANDANDLGGGIFNNVMRTVTVDGSTISFNEANHGGGIYNFGLLTIQNSGTISANEANFGGGIYNTGTLTIKSGSTIGGSSSTGNQALFGSGGGIYNDDNGATAVDASIVSFNTASVNGGGVYINDGTLTVDNSSVNGNSATYSGGGVYNADGTLIIQNGSIIGGVGTGNTAEFNGGGIYNDNGTTTVDGSFVSANLASISGGGIYNYSVLYVQNGSTIGVGNTAATGGGIYNHTSAVSTVDGSRLLSNTASTTGGGVYNDSDSAGATSVTGSCIVGNSDASFDNNQVAEQVATGNWWGAPTGPNTPGADTTSGNVDVSGYLSAPILNCAPDLQVDKSNDTGGSATIGTPFHWTLTITNTGLISATFDLGETILEDDLPMGPTYGTPLAGNFVDVANSANLECSITSNTLICAASGGDVTLGPITGSFEVTFSVTPNALGTLVNPAGICQVDPDDNIVEGDEGNNNCAVNVVDVNPRNIYLPLVLR